eukprot:354311-Chlamydomonas_euryale.AAC.4
MPKNAWGCALEHPRIHMPIPRAPSCAIALPHASSCALALPRALLCASCVPSVRACMHVLLRCAPGSISLLTLAPVARQQLSCHCPWWTAETLHEVVSHPTHQPTNLPRPRNLHDTHSQPTLQSFHPSSFNPLTCHASILSNVMLQSFHLSRFNPFTCHVLLPFLPPYDVMQGSRRGSDGGGGSGTGDGGSGSGDGGSSADSNADRPPSGLFPSHMWDIFGVPAAAVAEPEGQDGLGLGAAEARARDFFLADLAAVLSRALRHVIAPPTAVWRHGRADGRAGDTAPPFARRVTFEVFLLSDASQVGVHGRKAGGGVQGGVRGGLRGIVWESLQLGLQGRRGRLCREACRAGRGGLQGGLQGRRGRLAGRPAGQEREIAGQEEACANGGRATLICLLL